jgi:hypothetical protein
MIHGDEFHPPTPKSGSLRLTQLFFPARCVQPVPVVGDPPGMAPIAGLARFNA